MPAPAPEAYFLLFLDGAPKDWRKASEVLLQAKVAAISKLDAPKACKSRQGLVRTPLPQSDAERAAQTLTQSGFRTVAIPYSKVIQAPQAFTFNIAIPSPEGLNVPTDAKGGFQALPWASICIVQVACVTPGGTGVRLPTELPKPVDWADDAPQKRDGGFVDAQDVFAVGLTAAAVIAAPMVGTQITNAGIGAGLAMMQAGSEEDNANIARNAAGIPLENGPPKPKTPAVWLELYSLEPLLRVRIMPMSFFRYDYLGTRRAPTSRLNFKLFLTDVMSHCKHAKALGYFGEALTGRSIDDPSFFVPEPEFEMDVTAILTREAYVRAQAP